MRKENSSEIKISNCCHPGKIGELKIHFSRQIIPRWLKKRRP
ncbi:hypothetical protein COO91_03453 [Nostoc flagelliforme CCNUN1]|uniref:Uncharacterized protein n=1 Tax=Nostoc flagelliforme CCNUN1 TaxID=2038116 RepID=A0A2K8SQ25_9NOSO|nr:hypothetical protein COO91_03453 [Nostoc flagelliforme CCNUN1]